jgi:hypothetical protein
MKEPATNNGCGRIPKNAEDKATTLRAQAWEKKRKVFQRKEKEKKKRKGKSGEREIWESKRERGRNVERKEKLDANAKGD